MNYEKQKMLALFAENTATIKKGFVWQDGLVKRLAALLYALENKPMDCDAVRESHSAIKSNTGVFSAFRGNMSLCLAAMLSLRDDRERLLTDTLEVYGLLKKAKFPTSDYLAVAAYQIAANVPYAQYGQAAANTRAFYEEMKARRWFQTGRDDTIYAAMLGLSGKNPVEGAEQIEQLFQRLKSEFSSKNSVQTLSQILVLGGKREEAVQHVLDLRNVLRGNNIKLDKIYTLPALGVLSLLPIGGEVIARDILEAQAFLRTQKGFGVFSLTSQELLLYASSIIASIYAENLDSINAASISTSIASIIIAQQIAIISAAASSAAVTASASS